MAKEMQEFNKHELKTFERNFISYYSLIKNHCPNLYKNGKIWYKKENKEIKRDANYFNIKVKTLTEICARLSIRNNWDRNKIDYKKVCIAKKWSIPRYKIKVCTPNTNKNMAFDIYEYKATIQPNGLKIYAFAKNLQLNKNYVTIDVWIKRAFTNCWDVEKFDMNSKQYEQLSNIVKKLAKQENLIPYQLQAIAWNGARNNIFNKDTIYKKGMYSEPKKKKRNSRKRVHKNEFSSIN